MCICVYIHTYKCIHKREKKRFQEIGLCDCEVGKLKPVETGKLQSLRKELILPQQF